MSEYINLCMGCMNKLDDNGRCLNCDYIDGTNIIQNSLATHTLLNNRYIVGKVIDYNGEGITYIGYDTVMNVKVYVREFMPDSLCTRVQLTKLVKINNDCIVKYKNYLAEFVELYKSLQKFRSISHIIKANDIFYENNTAYIIIDYFDGYTLDEFLSECSGEMSWDTAKKLFSPLFTTLSLLHNSGIIHLGLSANTIYITKDGELKITGFCISDTRKIDSDLNPELFAGYSAPEQYSINSCTGCYTDVYSICAVLYRVLTGVRPADALSCISDDDFVAPAEVNPKVPYSVSVAIRNGMKISRFNRIDNVTALVSQLYEKSSEDDEEKENNSENVKEIKLAVTDKRNITPAEKRKKAANTPIKRNNRLKTDNDSYDSDDSESKWKIPFMIAIIAAIILTFMFLIMYKIIFPSDETAPVNETPTDDTVCETEDIGASDSENTQQSSIDSETIVSLEEPQFSMPLLIGKNYDTISKSQTLLEWIELIPEYDYNEEYQKNYIYEQSVDAEKMITAGTKVNVKVSLGLPYAIVPNFVGVSQEDYIKMLDELKIKYQLETQESDSVMEGYVVNTSKPVGDRIDLKENEVLTVYIAKN